MSSSRARYRTTTPGSSTRRAGSRQSPISASSRSRADSCSREQITFLVTARCATRPYRITVLTTDEVRAILLFSALESKDLEHLARTSEDIHLRGGERAVHEGGERALFAVTMLRVIQSGCARMRSLSLIAGASRAASNERDNHRYTL